MGEDKEQKITASEVLFQNVYQISEDMIGATYKIVEELAKYDTVFSNMNKRLADINANLDAHVVKQKWIKAADKKKCQGKILQAQEVADVCDSYSKICREAANDLIVVTEHFESNKKVKDIIKNLVNKLHGEAKKLKDVPPPPEEDDDDC